jgi:Ribbon-helix-helix protein
MGRRWVSRKVRRARRVHSRAMPENQNDRTDDKPARLTVLIDVDRKKAFEQLCAEQDITASQVVRQLIREYLARHGVSWQERH